MDDDCDLSTQLHDSILLQSVRWLQIFVTVSSILLSIFVTRYYLRCTIFDSVTIWFIKILFGMNASYSIGLGATQVAHVIARNIAVSPCDAEIPKPLCLFRMAAASITPSFVFIHCSITIQQALSTFKCSMRIRKNTARLTILLTLCYMLLFAILSFHNVSFDGTTHYCSSFNEKSEVFTIINLNLMMTVDLLNFICAILLLRHNKAILKKERSTFDLSRTFPRVQNLYAMAQFLPIISIHSISHLVHFCLYSYIIYFRPNHTPVQFTILYAVVNIMPYYCLFSPLVFLILTKLGRFRRKDHVRNLIAPVGKTQTQEVYFNNLAASWDKPK